MDPDNPTVHRGRAIKKAKRNIKYFPPKTFIVVLPLLLLPVSSNIRKVMCYVRILIFPLYHARNYATGACCWNVELPPG